MIDHHHLRAVDRDITHHQQHHTAVVLVAIDLAHHPVVIDLAHLLLIIVVVDVDLDLLQVVVVGILVAMR